jgi:uncharacterized membrane protein
MSKKATSNQSRTDPVPSTVNPVHPKESRLIYFDALRGFIMILMALDHASYFIAHKHVSEFWGIPLPEYQSPLAFLTRFVTHFSAPGFFFLMGVGMTLFASSRRQMGWTENAIRKHFILRGLLLIVLQILVEAPVWLLGPVSEAGTQQGGGSSALLYFGVLYGLGAAMIVSALLLQFNSKILIGIGAAAVLATQILTPGADQAHTLLSPAILLLLTPGHTNIVEVLYPLIPWLGLTLFGAVFARWTIANPTSTPRRAMLVGAGFVLLFLLVRIGNGFGNIHPVEGSSWMDFLNVTKYPPSLAFILLTLGMDLLFLYLFSRVGAGIKQWGKPLLVFGQAPLFFYLMHLYLFGIASHILAPANGTSLPIMYLYWAGGLVVLYPLCVWYGKFKSSKPAESIWRFF